MRRIKQRSRRKAVSDDSMPNLFTLCTLQAFATHDSPHASVKYPVAYAVLVLRFDAPISRRDARSTRYSGVFRIPTVRFDSSLSGSAVSVATFNQF